MCGPTNVTCHIGEGFRAVAENGLKALTKAIGEAAMEAMNGVATFWIKQPTPTLVVGADGKSPQNSEMVAFLQGNVLEIAAIIFILAVLVAGIRTAWEQRAQPLQQLLKATLVFVAVSAAGAATLQLLSEYSDWFAEMIIKSVLPEDSALGPALGGLVLRGSLGPITGDQTASLMTMLIGMFVIIGGLVQVVLMVIRSALAGTFPLAAAATNTEIGKAWFKKYCGWALAFVAYKPAAALIYAAAMKMNQIGVGGSGNTFVRTATGLMMLFLAIFALPALLRFMIPVTAAVAGGRYGHSGRRPRWHGHRCHQHRSVGHGTARWIGRLIGWWRCVRGDRGRPSRCGSRRRRCGCQRGQEVGRWGGGCGRALGW